MAHALYIVKSLIIYLKENTNKFISKCSNRNQVFCLEELVFSEKTPGMKYFRENISGKREDLLMRTFAILCRFQSYVLNSSYQICLWIILAKAVR